MRQMTKSSPTWCSNTEEEMDAAAALLSLGEMGNETLDDNNENAELMPIGGQNVPLDIAPQPIRLDQLSVDNVIAEMTQANDQLEDISANMKTEEQAEVQTVAKPDDATKDNTTGTKSTLPAAPPPASENKQDLATKGTLRTKTYTLKKKTNTKHRSLKCSECDVVKKSIRELNIHHEECHNPKNMWHLWEII